MYDSFCLNFGYAESAGIAFIPMVYSGEKFKKLEDAIIHLASFIKNKYENNINKLLNKCCEKYRNKNFCAICGFDIRTAAFDGYLFKEFCIEFCSKTNDSYGFSFEESQNEFWTPNVDISIFLKNNPTILLSAENILLSALEEPQKLSELIKNSKKEFKNKNIIVWP